MIRLSVTVTDKSLPLLSSFTRKNTNINSRDEKRASLVYPSSSNIKRHVSLPLCRESRVLRRFVEHAGPWITVAAPAPSAIGFHFRPSRRIAHRNKLSPSTSFSSLLSLRATVQTPTECPISKGCRCRLVSHLVLPPLPSRSVSVTTPSLACAATFPQVARPTGAGVGAIRIRETGAARKSSFLSNLTNEESVEWSTFVPRFFRQRCLNLSRDCLFLHKLQSVGLNRSSIILLN